MSPLYRIGFPVLTSFVVAFLFLIDTASGREPITVRSQSGQFIVRGLPWDPSWPRNATGTVDYLRLDPSIAAVALERIRHAAFSELGLDESWRGAVQVSTFPVQDVEPRLTLTSVRFNDAWVYRLEIPELVSKQQFIEIGVKVSLLEFANRTAQGEQEANLPDWLVKGLSAHLRATSLVLLALDSVVVLQRDYDPLRSARATLRQTAPLKFDELAMPSQEQLGGDGAAVFEACAHVFVYELLRLRAGAVCLGNMLTRLPENLNWQTTFLRAFQPKFTRLVDVDKWYSVTIASFTTRDAMSVWPAEMTLDQLDDVLGTMVEVRTAPNELPVTTPVTLQQMIREWSFARQYPVLLRKLQQLQVVRMRSAPQMSNLVDAYVRTLENYLRTQPTADSRAASKAPAKRAKAGIDVAAQQLDALDAQRETQRLRLANAPER
jgi:hypothetical protein